MRCICCNSVLPPVTVYRTILVPHETEAGKTTTMRIEEDLCNKCVTKSNPFHNTEEAEDLGSLGVSLPSGINYDY